MFDELTQFMAANHEVKFAKCKDRFGSLRKRRWRSANLTCVNDLLISSAKFQRYEWHYLLLISQHMFESLGTCLSARLTFAEAFQRPLSGEEEFNCINQARFALRIGRINRQTLAVRKLKGLLRQIGAETLEGDRLNISFHVLDLSETAREIANFSMSDAAAWGAPSFASTLSTCFSRIANKSPSASLAFFALAIIPASTASGVCAGSSDVSGPRDEFGCRDISRSWSSRTTIGYYRRCSNSNRRMDVLAFWECGKREPAEFRDPWAY
jgi:hypothetical protein